MLWCYALLFLLCSVILRYALLFMLYSIKLCYALLCAVMLYYALLCSVVLCYSCLVPLDTHRFVVSLLPSLAQSAFCFDTFPSLTRFPFYVRPGLPEVCFYASKTLHSGTLRSSFLDLLFGPPFEPPF